MLVMAGCMIETSLGITAAAHFAPLLDYADFDGAALLANDPYVGATIDGGRIAIPIGTGTRRSGQIAARIAGYYGVATSTETDRFAGRIDRMRPVRG